MFFSWWVLQISLLNHLIIGFIMKTSRPEILFSPRNFTWRLPLTSNHLRNIYQTIDPIYIDWTWILKVQYTLLARNLIKKLFNGQTILQIRILQRGLFVNKRPSVMFAFNGSTRGRKLSNVIIGRIKRLNNRPIWSYALEDLLHFLFGQLN